MTGEGFAPFVVLVACTIAFALVVGRRPQHAGILWGGFALHLGAAIAQVWITRDVYGLGDMLSYWRVGSQLALVLEDAPARALPEILGVIAQRAETHLPVEIHGLGRSTGSMNGYAALLAFATRGSLVAGCMIVATSALVGKLLVFRTFSPTLPETLRRYLLLALVALPSATYWSAGVLKESLSMFPLCVSVWGVGMVLKREYVRGVVAIMTSAIVLATLKPYLLFPLVIAAGGWIYANRVHARKGKLTIRLTPLIAITVTVIALLLLIGELFPRYALSNIEAEANRLQEVGVTIEGGSNYQLGGNAPAASHGPLAQFLMLPIALLTALFRPFLFEVRNPLAALAATETTLALIVTARALSQTGWRTIRDRVLASPALLFCVAFTVIAGAAIGLSTTNFGTLSRYRSPMVPFFAIALLASQREHRPKQKVRLRPAISFSVRLASRHAPKVRSAPAERAERSSEPLTAWRTPR